MTPRTGQCLCGAVRFTVTGEARRTLACHCQQCRRQSGHYWVSTDVAEADLAVTGADQVRWYQASEIARRGFCGTCGSFLFWKPLGQPRLAVAAGAFDAPSGLTIDRHIFCASKGDYYTLTDGLPQDPGD